MSGFSTLAAPAILLLVTAPVLALEPTVNPALFDEKG